MTIVYLALYKGKKSGKGVKAWAARLCDWAIRTITRGQYSHCEIAIDLGGQFECYSASLRDGGVRVKTMPLPSDKWDLLPVPDEVAARTAKLYSQTKGADYDLAGIVGIALKTRHSRRRWFCSEWCAAALDLYRPETYTPQMPAERFQAA